MSKTIVSRLKRLGAAAVLLAAGVAGAAQADTIKVGIIGPYSGPFALQGKNFQAGVEAYLAQNGKTVAGHTIEIVYRDLPGANPQQARALGAGTDRARQGPVSGRRLLHARCAGDHAAARTSERAAGDFQRRDIGDHEFVAAGRAHLVHHFADGHAARQGGDRTWCTKKFVTAVSDYGPGIDAENAFKKAIEAAGGQVAESIRMPMNTNEFSPIMQRVRAAGAEGSVRLPAVGSADAWAS